MSQSPAGLASFTPSVHVTRIRKVAVTYYDFRNNTPNPNTLPTDYWIAGGFFTGDDEGLSNIGNTFVPFFVQANSGNTLNRTDAFFIVMHVLLLRGRAVSAAYSNARDRTSSCRAGPLSLFVGGAACA